MFSRCKIYNVCENVRNNVYDVHIVYMSCKDVQCMICKIYNIVYTRLIKIYIMRCKIYIYI